MKSNTADMAPDLCIYHSRDLDGICSGVICKLAHPDVELFGYDYGQSFPWDKIIDRNVVMVDVSLDDFEDMKKIMNEAASFVFIDHHASIISQELQANERGDTLFTETVLGPRRMGRTTIYSEDLLPPEERISACELSWEYFFPDVEMPKAVYLLGRYDIWDHADPDVLPFQYGARFRVRNGVYDPVWDTIMKRPLWNQAVEERFTMYNILQQGALFQEYEAIQNEKYAGAFAFDAILDGHKILACNIGLYGSKVLESMWDPEIYDAMFTFCMIPDGRFRCSIYTSRSDIDVSKLAVAYGGGGHTSAAGFLCDELPFVRDGI